MRILVYILVVLLLLAPEAMAESLTEQDRASFRDIISSQIEAFRADDGPRAYSYAAPTIRRIFPNPDIFMSMVREGYRPVYRPQSFAFGEAEIGNSGLPVQRVTIVGPDGLTYDAVYTMERQPDGTWRINGCSIVRAPDISA